MAGFEDNVEDDFCELSLTAVANKSIDMSRSLTEKCVQFADLQLGDDVDSSSSDSVSSRPLSPGRSKDHNCQYVCINKTIMVGISYSC